MGQDKTPTKVVVMNLDLTKVLATYESVRLYRKGKKELTKISKNYRSFILVATHLKEFELATELSINQ